MLLTIQQCMLLVENLHPVCSHVQMIETISFMRCLCLSNANRHDLNQRHEFVDIFWQDVFDIPKNTLAKTQIICNHTVQSHNSHKRSDNSKHTSKNKIPLKHTRKNMMLLKYFMVVDVFVSAEVRPKMISKNLNKKNEY